MLIKANTILSGTHINNSKISDPRVKSLKRFLKENEEVVLSSIDKQVDLIFLQKTEYHQKLQNLLDKNFKRLENYDSVALEHDLQDFRKLLTKTSSGCLPVYKIRSLFPSNSLSSFYGQVKLHKPSEPLRGIATSYDSMVNNAEKFLKKILEPIAKECTFSFKNTKEFKQRFLESIDSYDPNIHKILTIDIQQMYSNINVVRCVSIILEKIYSEPSKYFQFKDKEGKTLPPPKRENFKQFLIKTLRKNRIVRSQIGILDQKS